MSDNRCRIGPYLDQGGAWRRRWPGASVPGSALGGPPGRTPGQPPQNAVIWHGVTAIGKELRVRLPPAAMPGPDPLFPAWRYHAIFTASPFQTIQG